MTNGEDHAWTKRGGRDAALEQMEKYKDPSRQVIRMSGEEFEKFQARGEMVDRAGPEVQRER